MPRLAFSEPSIGSTITRTLGSPKSTSPRSSDRATNRWPSARSPSSSPSTTSSADRSVTRVRSPPLPRVPVSIARSEMLVVSASICSSPVTARRQAPSQSASSAERVEVIVNLCCQTVSARDERVHGRAQADLPSLELRLDALPAGPATGPVARSQPGNPDLIVQAELLDGLLSAQREAVTHRGGPLLVIGEPGSGQTRVIQTRFRWLAAQGCEPERVALLVPSAARAIALRKALEPSLDRGYERLYVLTPVDLAALILRGAGGYPDSLDAVLGAGDRLAMLVERIDQLSLRHHDFGGRVNTLLAGLVARIDRLKAELIGPEEYLCWAASLDLAERPEAELEREFAEIYAAHERILDEVGGSDSGNLVRQALAVVQQRPGSVRPFDQVLLDDAQDLDLAPAPPARPGARSGG